MIVLLNFTLLVGLGKDIIKSQIPAYLGSLHLGDTV